MYNFHTIREDTTVPRPGALVRAACLEKSRGQSSPSFFTLPFRLSRSDEAGSSTRRLPAKPSPSTPHSPDLRELSGRGRSLFHPGRSEEEYPPTRVIDACRREPRPHQIPVPRRPQPESTALTTPNPRESRRSRQRPEGLSHHRPGRSRARRPWSETDDACQHEPRVASLCHTGFLSRATRLKHSRPPRLNALSSTLSPPSKQDSPDME